MPPGLKNPFSRRSTLSEKSRDQDVDSLSSHLSGLRVQKKHYDEDLLESELLRQDPHLWAAKATLMNLLLQTINQQRLSAVTIDTKSVLVQLVAAYQANCGGQNGPNTPFVESALYKAFPSPRDADHDLTAQLAAMLVDICGAESRDQIPELHAVSSQSSGVFATQSSNQAPNPSATPPSQNVKMPASSRLPPSPPEMNVIWGHGETYRSTTASVVCSGTASVSAISGYNTPSRQQPIPAGEPRFQTFSRETAGVALRNTHPSPSPSPSQRPAHSFPSSQSSPSPSMPTTSVGNSTPVPYPSLPNDSPLSSGSPRASGISGNPPCLWCESPTKRNPTQSNANGNAGRYYFKCSGRLRPDCKRWMGWSERDAGRDQGSTCRCGVPARGQLAPNDSAYAAAFRYVCRAEVCGFEAYP